MMGTKSHSVLLEYSTQGKRGKPMLRTQEEKGAFKEHFCVPVRDNFPSQNEVVIIVTRLNTQYLQFCIQTCATLYL